jgi:lysophospholipase L1-like esterase
VILRLLVALAAVLALVAGSTAGSTAAPSAPSARMCADLAADRLTVENMGDSIASGHGVPERSRWTTLLSRQLRAPVWQGAVGGTTVRDYLPGGAFRFHVDFTRNVGPSLVIMNWRINDQWMSLEHQGYTPDDFKAQYSSILADIRASSPSTEFMIAVSPWVLDSRIDGRYNQWDYIMKLWELKEQYGAIWMDWMRFMPPNVQDAPELVGSDGLHPSTLAQSVIAAHTHDRITSYCEGISR